MHVPLIHSEWMANTCCKTEWRARLRELTTRVSLRLEQHNHSSMETRFLDPTRFELHPRFVRNLGDQYPTRTTIRPMDR